MNTNNNQNLPFATDEECAELRQRLIRAGKIIRSKNAAPEVKMFDPLPPLPRRNAHDIPEEGTYKSHQSNSEQEYERRKHNYFIVLQEVLRSRIDLNLEFGEEEE